MKLDRLRAPALAATAILVLSGAGVAFAGSPTPATPAPPAPVVQTEPVVPDTDALQQGDQTTPDVAGAAVSAAKPAAAVASTTKAAEPTGPDTDTLQQGDQNTPDVAGASTIDASATVTSETATEASAGTEAAGTEATGTASDGPGGHADPAGQSVDHQFDGQE